MSFELLLLTEPNKVQEDEDNYLAERLSEEFCIRLVSNDTILDHLTNQCGILIRNNWPVSGQEEVFWKKLHSVYSTLRERKIPCYNSLFSKGDMYGKVYLDALRRKCYPAIPTIINKADFNILPVQEKYVIKPIFGGDSWKLEILDKDTILKRNTDGYVIQPFINICKEVHYVFIDNEFVYAFAANSRREDPMPEDLSLYEPSQKEIDFAQQFVDWNNLTLGLQRIDIITTEDNRLLLNELEDHCPHMWLSTMPETVQEKFISRIKRSIKHWTENIFTDNEY